jgi:mRNA interferase HigB
MNVIAHKTLVAFWGKYPHAEGPASAWYAVARRAQWRSPQDIRDAFNSADFLANNRVIFDLGGNKYRLVVRVSYEYKHVLIKWIGTHKEYDKIDPATV